jgi:tight adherence protein B
VIARSWPVMSAVLAVVVAVVTAVPVGGGRRRARVLGLPGRRRVPVRALAARLAVRVWRLRTMRGAAVVVAATIAAVPASIAGGPVAAVVAAVYAALVVCGLRRRERVRQCSAERTQAVDALTALAADLRAGLPPPTLGPARDGGYPPVWRAVEARRLVDLAVAAAGMAERTGAPLAELIERIEADARASDRAAAMAAAQAAGARTTALLLAALPAGGIALGYWMGVDPLHVLLRTPLGAGCALAALLLQVGGLVWADRLARVPTGGPGAGSAAG